MALALSPSSADSLRNLREVRAWWRAHHPAASLGHRLELLYTIALVGAMFGALAYGTASSALAQVVTPHSLAVFGPSLALLAVLLAMHWGAYQGPVVFSVPDVAFLLGAPLPRQALAVRRLVLSLAGGAVAGAGLAAVVLVGLAGNGRGIDTSEAAGVIVGLAKLGTTCVAGAWAVERSQRIERAFRRATWPGVLTALGLAVVSGAGSVGREVAFWAGPWGWAVHSNTGVGFAEWVAALLALTAFTAVAAGAAIRTCGDASGERHLRRAEARAGAIASLASFDARTARQTLATVSTRETGRSRSGLSWLRASLATRGSQPAARTLAIFWRNTVAALRTPGRVVEAAALAAGGTVLSLLNTDKPVAVAVGMVLGYFGVSRMLWPLRAELDLPSRTTVMLRPRLGRVLLAHALLPALVTTSAATLAAVGCAIAGALPTHGAIGRSRCDRRDAHADLLRRDVGPAPRSAAPKPSLRRRGRRSVRRRCLDHRLAGLLAHPRRHPRQHPPPTHHTLQARSHPRGSRPDTRGHRRTRSHPRPRSNRAIDLRARDLLSQSDRNPNLLGNRPAMRGLRGRRRFQARLLRRFRR